MKTVKLNLRPLKSLQARLGELGQHSVKVGLLASTSSRVPARPDDIPHNPSVGAMHEFGLGTPRRSFIQMPLTQHLDETVQKDDTNWIEMLMKRGPKIALKRLGKLGEETIDNAFKTAGWGQWPPLAPITRFRKIRNKNRVLIETQQMRRAITSEVA